jgi:hypothetical protein
MGFRLWLDDKRPPPWGYDLWAKTADEAICMLQEHEVEHCSLDHDLHDSHYADAVGSSPPTEIDRSGYTEKTGYEVLSWMHENDRWCPDISVHTMNPRGGDDMMNKLQNRAPKWVVFRRVWLAWP